jgi:hypothetical protein
MAVLVGDLLGLEIYLPGYSLSLVWLENTFANTASALNGKQDTFANTASALYGERDIYLCEYSLSLVWL